ncbi:wax ester/triacylglycerol synthase family O-acyltransferase [Nocardioides sp.]|uniref:wax ester/triacylglycerol synthase family O-acyltransferase n=1 Tax=Nocardioides sp. TaxID=35761 RepID=UPI003784E6EA
MDRLTPLSYAFLAAEDVDPAACLVIGSMAVIDGPAPPLDEVRALVAERLPSVPRYTQRIESSRLGLQAPAWVDVAEVDLTEHVTELAVPAPGGRAEVAAVTAGLLSQRMDRSRPLWDVTVCHGLPEDRWGLVMRVHHALADGISGTGLYHVVFDSDGARDEPPPPAPRAAPGVARHGLIHTAVSAARGAIALGAAMWPTADAGLLGPLDGERRYAWVEVDIPSTAALRHHLGVSLNDLVLAAVAGGLRELLLARGRQPDPHALRSLLPVSSRTPGTSGSPDNQVTLMLSVLPVEVADPVDRVRAVHERVAALRAAHEPEAGVAMQQLAGLLPFPVVHWGLHAIFRFPQQQVSTVTTNVPGPRAPLTCLGRPVRQLLPVVPIAERVQLGFAVLSYVDTLTFGITADAGSSPDVEVLADAVGASWQALLDAVPVDG